jgi:hypothetical protein
MPIFQNWGLNNISARIESKVLLEKQKTIMKLAYAGEHFINDARDCGAYTDRTGNLRHSIGYSIIDNGEVIRGNVAPGASSEASEQVAISFEEILDELPKDGLVLVCFAGMKYASAVESKGYDVISNAARLAEILLNEIIGR